MVVTVTLHVISSNWDHVQLQPNVCEPTLYANPCRLQLRSIILPSADVAVTSLYDYAAV